MGGIIGCLAACGGKSELLSAQRQMHYATRDKDDEYFEDHMIKCTRTHLDLIGESSSPIIQDHICTWVQGEFYNKAEIRKRFQIISKTEGSILGEAYLRDQLLSVLNRVDGYFSAMLYDKKRQELLFISDRYGIKPLYIWQKGENLIWSSEVKCFLSFSTFQPELKTSSINQFLSLGHLFGNNSWFLGIELLPASTVQIYSLKENKTIKKERYWSWNQVPWIDISYEEAEKRLIELLRLAVQKRSRSFRQPYAISLSGGLDSRTILACLENDLKLESFTFGLKNSDEVKIARKLSKKKKIPHHVFELNKQNWFDRRVEGIWKSEGGVNLIHLHATAYQEQISQISGINFNGFAGHLILGGSAVQRLNQRIDESSIGDLLSLDKRLNPNDSFFDIDKTDPFYLDLRLRRFTAQGLNEVKWYENRIPLMDNELLQFIYGIPDEFRTERNIYIQALRNAFPQFMNGIPIPGKIYTPTAQRRFYHWPLDKFSRLLILSNLKQSRYAKYNKWIGPYLEFFDYFLNKKNNLLIPILKESANPKAKETGMNFRSLTRKLTLEIWFQQVFNNNYKTSEELLEEFHRRH